MAEKTTRGKGRKLTLDFKGSMGVNGTPRNVIMKSRAVKKEDGSIRGYMIDVIGNQAQMNPDKIRTDGHKFAQPNVHLNQVQRKDGKYTTSVFIGPKQMDDIVAACQEKGAPIVKVNGDSYIAEFETTFKYGSHTDERGYQDVLVIPETIDKPKNASRSQVWSQMPDVVKDAAQAVKDMEAHWNTSIEVAKAMAEYRQAQRQVKEVSAEVAPVAEAEIPDVAEVAEVAEIDIEVPEIETEDEYDAEPTGPAAAEEVAEAEAEAEAEVEEPSM